MPGPVLDLQQAGAADHRGYFTHTAHTTPDGTALDRHSGVIAHQPGAALMVGFPTVPIADAPSVHTDRASPPDGSAIALLPPLTQDGA